MPSGISRGRGLNNFLEGGHVENGRGHVYLAPTVVRMGWLWAFWLVQRAHLEMVSRENTA